MPITIQPATLRYKSGNQFVSVDCLKGDDSSVLMAPEYSALTFPVSAGQHCIYSGAYYVANQAIATSETWTAAHWDQVTVGEEIKDIESDLANKYEKPAGGIPASDIASGVIPDISELEEDVSDLKSAISGMTVEEKLLRSELPGTTVAVTFDSNDNPSTITHSKNSTTVRIDVFTWTANSVTEVRTLSSGESITIETNLETLAQTISEVEVA